MKRPAVRLLDVGYIEQLLEHFLPGLACVLIKEPIPLSVMTASACSLNCPRQMSQLTLAQGALELIHTKSNVGPLNKLMPQNCLPNLQGVDIIF